jgi:hypothetical protein
MLENPIRVLSKKITGEQHTLNKPHDPTFSLDHYVSSNKGTVIASARTANFHPELKEKQDVFSFETYQDKHGLPHPLPEINTDPLAGYHQRCLDMPIRLSGQTVYRVPKEWSALLPMLQAIISTEHDHNPNVLKYNTYITVDSKMVEPDEQQRHGGLHVDGFQGERIDPKTKITRNYVVTTNGGTRFYQQPFVVVDEKKYNVFQGFDLQAKDYMIAEENTVYFMDAYTVHESGIASRKDIRSFLRVTYDLKKFDRLGNTHNSMLDYNWDMEARNVHEIVDTPTMDDIANSPYRTKS